MEPPLNAKRTIHDVANEAGVSTSTVSFVLNNRPGVGEQTRRSVLAVVQRLNYIPDRAAQELASKAMKSVGLSVSPSGRRLAPFPTLYRERLFDELQRRGFRPEELATRSDGLPERISDLTVLMGLCENDPRLHYLREHHLPFIVFGHLEGADVPWLAQDNYGGGKQATEHLLQLNHKDILFVLDSGAPESLRRRDATGPFLSQVANERYRGYRDALLEAGIPVNADLSIVTDFTTLGAYRAVTKALRSELKFSAVFAISDELAVGAIAALEDAGLRVPIDVSVVGFDDMPEVGEHLTTVRQDIPLLAAATVELVQEALEGKAPRHIEVPVQLIVRGTTERKRGLSFRTTV